MSDYRNFARIEFTHRECEAMRELRTFVDQLSAVSKVTTTSPLNLLRLSLRRAVENIGKMRAEGFTPVDMTLDQCKAVDECGEFFEELCRGNEIHGSARPGLQSMRVAMASARMKCSAAALMIKPDYVTDLRLN